MTQGEAKAYLSFYGEQNIEDHYEDYLFRQKAFFRQKPISKKIYSNQCLKIQKAIEAYEILGFTLNKSPLVFHKTLFNENLKEIFDQYHHTRNQLFQQIYSTQSLFDLLLLSKELLQVEKQYCSCFENCVSTESTNTPPNPMDVLQDIKGLNKAGVYFIRELNTIEFSTHIHLVAEINRLKRLEN
jgi:hypothetical protein